MTTLGSGKCTIQDVNGNTIGQVPWSVKAVYKVVHDDGAPTNAIDETVTWTELHCWMGHISSGIAKKLKRVLLLVYKSICESCIYTKATQKPVVKDCEGEQATEFSGEIHSDLWRPAPVTTIKGHHYYVSFKDDKTCLTDLYLLKHKSDTLQVYKEYEAS